MNHKLTLLAVGLLVTNAADAATEVNLHKQPAAYLQRQLTVQNNGKMKIQSIRTDVDFNHTAHTRIQQTYDGIPVWGATGVIHAPHAAHSLKNNFASVAPTSTMNGVIYEGLEKDLTKRVSSFAINKSHSMKALDVAKNVYAKNTRTAVASFKDEKIKPIIFIDDNKQAHYAYLTSFTYSNESAVHRPTSIVDAETHQVYRTWDGIYTASANETRAINEARAKLKRVIDGDEPATPDLYDVIVGGVGGNEKVGEIIYDGSQAKTPNAKAMDVDVEIAPGTHSKLTVCALINDDISVVDTSLGGEQVSGNCLIDSKSEKKIGWMSVDKGMKRWKEDEMNDGYSPSLDAFYAAMAVKNMYQDWYNIPALIDAEGKPKKYLLRVHFGRKFDNAFWDGEQMTFGDGFALFYPLTSVSVTAHEISHGFTQTHSNIDGGQPQMAALHESFSDMAAVTVENYLTGKNAWELGREIKKDEGAMRYLNNPTKDGYSIDHMKDFDVTTEAHHGAGVTNKAFFLLATTKGWSTRKAFDVWVKANMHYWTSSMTTLNEAACGVVAATKDYNYSIADVRIAFGKVGIDTDTCEATA